MTTEYPLLDKIEKVLQARAIAAFQSLFLLFVVYFREEFISLIGNMQTETASKVIMLLSGLLLLIVPYLLLYGFRYSQLTKRHVNSITKENSDTFHNILSLIAKYHSQEISATPKRIADDLGLDPGITLTHMVKYHNELCINFSNGGKQPDLNTSFYLCQEAWKYISIVQAE